jgi:ABC-type multidrug transport system fused ATPase/permease subunit
MGESAETETNNYLVFKLLYRFFEEEKVAFIVILILVVITNIIQTNVISSINSTIIDSLEHAQNTIAIDQYKYLVGASVLYFLLFSVNEYIQIHTLTKLTPWMRIELFKYIVRSNNEEFTQMNVNKYNSPINRVSYSATSIIHNFITSVVSNIAFVLVITGFFLYKNTTLGMTFLILNLFLVAYWFFTWGDIMKYKNIYEDQLNHNEMVVIDLFNNFDKIIYRGQAESEIKSYEERANTCIQRAVDYHSKFTKDELAMLALVYLIVFLGVGYLIYSKMNKTIDMKTFITFFTILLLYREKISSLLETIPNYMEFHGRLDYAMKFFSDVKGEHSNQKIKQYDPVDLPFSEIRFENVSYKYKVNSEYLFQNLNMTIHSQNKIVGLTGVSGRGKSTIMKLLLKLYDYNEGNIYIDDVNIRDIDPAYIRKNITYVNQSAKLFDKPVIDNMLYGCSNTAECKTHLDVIMQYPLIRELYKNIDLEKKNAGSLGESLSGGQRQVVNILSGLVNPSKILILDEPTNALDLTLKTELLGIINEFRQYKQCIIIITHDRDVYSLFDERINI